MANDNKNDDPENLAAIGRCQTASRFSTRAKVDISPFVGRLGGNGFDTLERNGSNEALLSDIPDAAPLMTLAEVFDYRPFRTVGLWKSALIEGIATMLLTWATIFVGISPAIAPELPTPRWGVFDNAAFIGPVTGAISNFLFLTLFIFTFGAVSGAHLNPLITIGTLFARLCSFPRAVLYVSFQTGGGALAGLLARASYGTRDFKTGGCWMYTSHVPVGDAFAIEFMASLTLIFCAFGVGLDPRQGKVVGPTLAPFLVGLTLAALSFSTGFSRYGYGGASMNPARCFGAFVGSRFQGYHWIHWAADILACGVHGLVYHIVPPWHTAPM